MSKSTKENQPAESESIELEDNFFFCDGSTLTSGLLPLSDAERQRRTFERELLDNRFNAYMSIWLSLGTWSLNEACRLLAGIPIKPIERDRDLQDRAHIVRNADYKHLLFVAKTYKNLVDGATPAEWLAWFRSSGVAKNISNSPKMAEDMTQREATPLPDTNDQNGEESADNDVSIRRNRLYEEIEMIPGFEAMTKAKIRSSLEPVAGKPNSCVTEVARESIKWKDANGNPQATDTEALGKWLQRHPKRKKRT